MPLVTLEKLLKSYLVIYPLVFLSRCFIGVGSAGMTTNSVWAAMNAVGFLYNVLVQFVMDSVEVNGPETSNL